MYCNPRAKKAKVATAASCGLPGNLARELLDCWCWGGMSAIRLQRVAAAAVQDGCVEPWLKDMSVMGSKGTQTQNCQRDLLFILQRLLPTTPSPCTAAIPLQCKTRIRWFSLPYIPLHRLLGFMFERFPEEWRNCVAGREGHLQDWWAQVPKGSDSRWKAWEPRLCQASGQQGLEHLFSKLVPLALHSDAVRVFKKKSLTVLSASSLAATGATKDLKLLMHSYWSTLVVKGEEDTEKALWKVVQWDLEACFSGTHPCQDFLGRQWAEGSVERQLAGQPWAAGHRAIPWIARADLDHFCKVWRLEHYGSNSPCPWCQANRSDRPWTDCNPDAAWRNTIWTEDAAWRVAHPQRHPIFDTLSMGIHSAVCDGPLHTLALGVAQHITGNLLMELLWGNCIPLPNVPMRLSCVWDLVQQYWSERKCNNRLARLDLQTFCDPSAPHADYPQVAAKGKETENLAMAVSWVWQQYRDEDDPCHQSISMVVEGMVFCFEICKQPGSQLSRVLANQLERAVDQMLLHYTALGNKAAAEGKYRWNFTPKFHCLWHWSRQCRSIHPRDTGTYQDEAFVGIIKDICKVSTSGVAIPRLPCIVTTKYLHGLQLRWLWRSALISS